MDSEIADFAERHRLEPAAAEELERLMERLGPAASRTLASLGDFQSVRLCDPDGDEPREVVPRAEGGRYDDLGSLGSGGMGEVRRVRDRELNRVVALKRVHAEIRGKPGALARFVEEAQATAQLQHPNIVPVYDAGVADDGRPWFTMKEVRGRSMSQVIREVHEGRGSLRRLIAAFHQVCNAVAYAHSCGVVHRDLKPENAMLGTHGEVYVVDWGLAKVLGRSSAEPDEDHVITSRASSGSHATRAGTVSGTPVYMAPEQALGRLEAIGPRTDVYGLGAILYEVLSGRVPVQEQALIAVLVRVASGKIDPLDDGADEDLVRICKRAMSVAPEDRYASAAELATEIEGWLDGARQRDRALEVVGEALALEADAEPLASEVASLRAEGEALLEAVESWSSEVDKAPGWRLLDRAQQLEDEALLSQVEIDHRLQGALRIAPDLPEAHAALAERYRARQAAAESARDGRVAEQAAVLLGHHARALREDHPVRRASLAWLKGDGALSLVTEPAGSLVLLQRYEVRNRRMQLGPETHIGRAPLRAHPLPMGSYLCTIRHPDCEDVRYPVHIGRQDHWEGLPPGASEPRAIRLPPKGSLDPGAIYVAAGWFHAGGDVDALRGGPLRREWLDGFAIDRFPVTNRQYIAFLDDLVARGEEEAAVRHAPRDRGGSSGEFGSIIYGRDGAGRFTLLPDADGDAWTPEMPVCMVDWHGARAFLAWRAETTGHPWRLPRELEWEKAARGVDGRAYPWGEQCDPSWTHVLGSLRDGPGPVEVDRFPVDASPYGVRGMAGNIADWCEDPFDGLERAEEDRAMRTAKGGAWDHGAPTARCASRHHIEPMARHGVVGFRGVYGRSHGAGR